MNIDKLTQEEIARLTPKRVNHIFKEAIKQDEKDKSIVVQLVHGLSERLFLPTIVLWLGCAVYYKFSDQEFTPEIMLQVQIAAGVLPFVLIAKWRAVKARKSGKNYLDAVAMVKVWQKLQSAKHNTLEATINSKNFA